MYLFVIKLYYYEKRFIKPPLQLLPEGNTGQKGQVSTVRLDYVMTAYPYSNG